jgi:hypothetical protein
VYCGESYLLLPLPVDSLISDTVNFKVDLPIPHVVPVLERSIQGEPIPATLSEEQPIRWEVVATGTLRGKPRLHNSLGYTYTVRSLTDAVTY